MRRLLKEIVLLIPGSVAAGWSIATVQHFVAFGALGGGFGMDALGLAFFEGGIVGGVAGIPTGLITYYLALRRRATPKRVAVVVLGSLFVGCLVTLIGDQIMGDGFLPFSVLTTPVLTVAIAAVANRWCPI